LPEVDNKKGRPKYRAPAKSTAIWTDFFNHRCFLFPASSTFIHLHPPSMVVSWALYGFLTTCFSSLVHHSPYVPPISPFEFFMDHVWNTSPLPTSPGYVIMFGPDRCGATNKVHFILQHKCLRSPDRQNKMWYIKADT
jgi:hypothetical protein